MNEIHSQIQHFPEARPGHGQTILVMRTPTDWVIAKVQFPCRENPDKYNPEYFTLWYAENGGSRGKLHIGRDSWYWLDFGEIIKRLNKLAPFVQF